MNRLIKSFTVDCLSNSKILSFRSTLLSSKTFYQQIDKKMVQNLTIDELKKRSAQAQELIDKLQKQIEQIKLQTTPASMTEKVKSLQTENEQLRNEVEQLKKELENAEAQRPTQSATAPVQQQAKPKAEAKQPAAKQAETKPKESKPAEAKPKQEAKKAPAPAVDQNVDISKLDIRVGKIVHVEKHPDAESLYVEQIDLGEAKPRNVCSGLVKFIPLEGMQDKMVVVLCNLKASKLRGVLSEAMVLCASTPEKVELLVPPAGAQIGDRVSVEGFSGEPAPECNPKNNIFGLVQPDFKTDDNLNATYKGKVWQIAGKGAITTSTLKNVPIK